MEGFLQKKGSGDRSFGRRNWKRRWFTLDDDILSYFENIDGLRKGSLSVKGCEISEIDHHEKKNVFSITDKQNVQFMMCADDDKAMQAWIKALKTAATGENVREINYGQYYDLLGLNEDDSPDIAAVNRAYRKKALKSHPDKGGDVLEFKKLQEACDLLVSKLEEEEKRKQYDEIKYEVVIQKGGKGVGFGMIVTENPKQFNVSVKDVLPTMRVQYLSDEARGEVKKGDVLLKIDKDDVTKWPLPRIVQRLSDVRVPVNSEVRLVFSRLVRKDGLDDKEPGDDNANDEPPEAASEPTAANQETPFNPKDEEGQDMHDKDDAGLAPSFDDEEGMASDPLRPKSQREREMSRDRRRPPPATPSSSSTSAFSPLYGAAGATVDHSVVDSMHVKLESSLRQLRESESARAAIAEALREATRTNIQLTAQLRAANEALAEYSRRDQLMSLQLQQLLLYSELTSDQVIESLKDSIDVAAVVTGGRPIAASQETEEELKKQGLGAGEVRKGSRQAAFRAAQIAAALVDPTGGKILKQWAAQGNAANEKLLRLEERLKVIQDKDLKEEAAAGDFGPPSASAFTPPPPSLPQALPQAQARARARMPPSVDGSLGFYGMGDGLPDEQSLSSASRVTSSMPRYTPGPPHTAGPSPSLSPLPYTGSGQQQRGFPSNNNPQQQQEAGPYYYEEQPPPHFSPGAPPSTATATATARPQRMGSPVYTSEPTPVSPEYAAYLAPQPDAYAYEPQLTLSPNPSPGRLSSLFDASAALSSTATPMGGRNGVNSQSRQVYGSASQRGHGPTGTRAGPSPGIASSTPGVAVRRNLGGGSTPSSVGPGVGFYGGGPGASSGPSRRVPSVPVTSVNTSTIRGNGRLGGAEKQRR